MQQPPLPYQQPPFIQPPKKSRTWLWIVALVVVFFAGYGAGHSPDTTTTGSTNTNQIAASQPTTANSTPTATSTPTPTPKPKQWTTTHTFSGSGNKKTAIFSVPDDWKLQWKCNHASFDGLDYNIIVDVNNSDSSPMDPSAINVLCKTGNTSGETEEHQSGNVYLSIESEADWTVTIQEFK